VAAVDDAVGSITGHYVMCESAHMCSPSVHRCRVADRSTLTINTGSSRRGQATRNTAPERRSNR